MSSHLRDIADALAAALAAETFTAVADQPTVDRKNWPTYDVEDLIDPVIAITPASMTVVRVDRVNHEYDHSINVALMRHTPTEAGADDMFDLLEELVDLIRSHDWDESVTFPSGVTSPMEVEVDLNPDEALQERNVWRGIVTVVYRLHRATT